MKIIFLFIISLTVLPYGFIYSQENIVIRDARTKEVISTEKPKKAETPEETSSTASSSTTDTTNKSLDSEQSTSQASTEENDTDTGTESTSSENTDSAESSEPTTTDNTDSENSSENDSENTTANTTDTDTETSDTEKIQTSQLDQKPLTLTLMEYKLTWLKKELDQYTSAQDGATADQKKVLEQLIATKKSSIQELEDKITYTKALGSDIVQMQQEVDQFKKEIDQHKQARKEAPPAERATLDALITLKQGLVDVKEQKIKEKEKEVMLKKPISYLESVVTTLEKEVAETKVALETAQPGEKLVLQRTIETKEKLIKELKSSITKRKTEKAQASSSVGKWQEQKNVLQSSIDDQSFIKDRASPALKEVISDNISMKNNAINQLNANIKAGTTGTEIEKIPSDTATFTVFGDDTFNDDEELDSTITASTSSETELDQQRIQAVAKKVMPEVNQDVYLTQLGVPTESPFTQTISVDNEMASQLTSQLSTYQSQLQSSIEDQQQKALERINIFNGEARDLKSAEKCKQKLAASGCCYKRKKTVRCCR